MKIKYIFLIIFFIINSLVFSMDIIEKRPILIGYNTNPSSFRYDWNMLSSFNRNTVIYVSDLYYIDTKTLEFTNYFTPDERYWFSIRPPFSNNIMPCVDKNGNYFSVNIETNEYESIPDEFYTYGNFLLDSDRSYNSDIIHTPEYSVTIESHWLFWFVGKDHRQIPAGHSSDGKGKDNNIIKDILLSEFKGTIFDNNYWFETLNNLLASCNLITKHTMSEDESDYLIERINSYFDVNVTDLLNDYFRTNIYEDGFFVYDSDKVILFDIKNHEIISYNIMEYNIPNNISTRTSFEIIVHNRKYFFIIFEKDRGASGVYKLEYD